MIPIKTGRQIDGMRAACGAAGRVLAKLADMVQPGTTTGEIDSAAADYISEEGCTSAFLGYRGFPGQICISVNEEVVHGIGGVRRIQYGDLLKLDVGVVCKGWVGDNAISVAAGAVDARVARLMEVTEGSLYAGIDAARDGNRLGDLCASIQEAIQAGGMSVVRDFVGHGVGRKLHEEPQIPNYGKRHTGSRLRAGMTLAIEPMVNLGRAQVKILSDGWTVVTSDGLPSAHYEHTVLVTEGEPEILTAREGAQRRSIGQSHHKITEKS